MNRTELRNLIDRLEGIIAHLQRDEQYPQRYALQDGIIRIAKTQAFEDLLATCQNQVAWIERLLQNLEHRTIYDRSGNPVNGFAGSMVPDWDLKQKLDSLKEDIAKAKGETT